MSAMIYVVGILAVVGLVLQIFLSRSKRRWWLGFLLPGGGDLVLSGLM